MVLKFIPPMLLTLVDAPPAGEGWLHEVKHDGYRMQLIVEGGAPRLYTRRGIDWTRRFSAVAGEAAALPCRAAIIDGEIVAQDERGVSHFDALIAGAPAVFIAFDLLHIDGTDLRRRPLLERRARLEDLVSGRDFIGFSEAFAGSPAELMKACETFDLEGIVSKRASSSYVSGRSKAWLKTKCWQESTLTLLGFEKDSDGRPIALLARDGDDGLEYAGGTLVGMPKEVRAAVEKLVKIPKPPITVPSRKKATWLEPTLRLRIRHLRGGGAGIRHASVKGLADALDFVGARAEKVPEGFEHHKR